MEKVRIVFLNGVIIDGIPVGREGAAPYYGRMTEILRELF